ncbi:MAG TPA: RNA polymerase sigma factor [Ignavibacteria bacterium]|nr:RNA polymerase subunit sigma-24 [Bacteroidota bacterium]HRE09773.1 RNA polymerase sigma factor [Ignavibacteria bacterium]HRF65502.1 RNA polymerase sigma factor [Ignavibacteria bacterium]HRJ03003.1 RNA polymerase sigma factor [Ignavibacteria bacterium]HRJ84892.1 RNA polymerase sigma factor [Ignavibacteria bacterium]
MEIAVSGELSKDLTLKENLERQNSLLKEVIEKERPRLLGFIKRRVAVESDAEDILQDVFYQFTKTMREDPIEKAASWLFKAASNKIIDWYRKIKPVSLDKLNESLFDEDVNTSYGIEDVSYSDAQPQDVMYTRQEFWPMMEELLNQLPEKQREVFIMHEFEGKSFKEISAITGTGINTLLSRKRYAEIFLREELKELYDEITSN